MAPTIEQLFETDYGIKFRGTGDWLSGQCPWHDDKSPSLSVQPEKGFYKCHGCGREGGVYDYLIEVRNLSKKEAYHLATGKTEEPKPKAQEKKKPYLWSSIPRQCRNKKPRVGLHEYLDADGKHIFTIARWVPGPNQPKVTPWHKVAGGWYQLLPEGLKARPLYRLRALLKAEKTRQVMIVEGEKCVEAVEKFFPRAVVTTWSGGAGSELHTDWTPLEGHDLLLVSDAEKKGRDTMLTIAGRLADKCGEIKTVLSPGEDGADIADWLAKGGAPEAARIIEKLNKPFGKPEPEPEPKPEPAKEKVSVQYQLPDDFDNNAHFEILGNAGDAIVVMLATSRVLYVSRIAITQPSTLISMADVNWLTDLAHAESLTPKNCQSIGSSLIRSADRKGQLDMTKIVGRGCYWNDGKLIWNLGDRLLINGAEVPLGGLESTYRPIAGARIKIDPQAASEDERKQVAEAVLGYRWLNPIDGKRFLGWLVSSIVGGGLPWRPHIWIAAPASTGKSWLLKEVARPVLQDMSINAANTTAAALARAACSDSVAVVLDEAEPDRDWVHGVMDLVRIAAGGDGARSRAEGTHAVQSFSPRFSALLSSVKVVRMTEADESRFVLIGLSSEPVDDWVSVRQAIEKAMLPGDRFKAGIIRDAPQIIERTKAITDELIGEGMGTRLAMITGALSAGWEWWSCGTELLAPDMEAATNLESDAIELLRSIMGLRLRTSTGGDTSMLALLAGNPDSSLAKDYGIRMKYEDLLIATKHPSLMTKLAPTRWKNIDVGKMLKHIEGVVPTAGSESFGHAHLRGVIVPRMVLDALGLDIQPAPTQEIVPF